MSAQSKVLFHPCFGQPKVENPALRGKKKGCASFQAAYRAREAKRSSDLVMAPIMTTEEAASKLIAEMTSDVYFLLSRIGAAAEIVEMERRVAK